MTNIILPPKLFRPGLILSWVGFGMCLLFVPCLAVGHDLLLTLVFGVLFVGIFPLWFGALSVVLSRRRHPAEIVGLKVWFRGLPRWFVVLYVSYSYIVVLGLLAGFIQQFRGQQSWVALGFLLIPSVFYLGSAGIYWSEVRLRETVASGAPPLLVPPMLRREVQRLKIRLLVRKHWPRVWPIWIAPVFFVTFVNVNPGVKLDDMTSLLLCIAVVLLFAGLPFASRSMKENDHPFIEKTLLLIAFPFWASAVLTHVAWWIALRG